MAKRLFCIFAICLLAGCGGQTGSDEPGPVVNDPEQSAPQTQNVPGTQNRSIDDPAAVARHLEELAVSIPGVKDARCVVLGNMAIVGIDVDEKLDRSRVGTLKYSVAEAFRKDPYGIDAFVTADMDLNERLREIRADIEAGHPVAGFAEELADIMGRIMPQLPRDIELRDPPETEEAPQTDGQL